MNIGILVISHGSLSQELVRIVGEIIPDKPSLSAFSFSSTQEPAMQQQQLQVLIDQIDSGHGVLLLVDVAGATPCNICRPLLKPGKVAMACGYNLPMLIKLAQLREEFNTPETLASFITDYGRKNIQVGTSNEPC